MRIIADKKPEATFKSGRLYMYWRGGQHNNYGDIVIGGFNASGSQVVWDPDTEKYDMWVTAKPDLTPLPPGNYCVEVR